MKYRITKMITVVFIGIFLIVYLLAHYDGHKYNIENAEAFVRKICELENVPGMSIVVLDNEQEYYINVGYADRNRKVDMTSEIRCELGSTTKAFTALGVLLLEQDGKLNRNDSVEDYLPWFNPTYEGKRVDITLEHLLCHTSGIPTWTIANLPMGTVNDVGLLEDTVKGI